MLKLIAAHLMLLCFTASNNPAFSADMPLPQIERSAEILEKWSARLDAANKLPDTNEKFDEIGKVIRGVGYFSGYKTRYNTEEFSRLLLRAQKAMIVIPGHADYLSKRISDLKPAWREDSNKVSYDNTRMWTMQTLQYIPSPDAVRVLGEFLADEEQTQAPITPGSDPDSFGPGSNASLAVDALKNLIEKPPVGADRNFQKPGDVLSWQLWYEQIKAGNRFFRFKGDPTEYDLSGPASKEKLQRVERDLKRDEERLAGHKKSTTDSDSRTTLTQITKPSAIAGILAACALLAGAVWYFLRGRKGA
jgi:hypothetical protein